MSHDHDHSSREGKGFNKLKIALALTFIYMIAEAVGGWLTNSLALIADAGHMFTDVAAMSLTLFAFWFAARPATSKKTYGYYRTEILAAFINGVALALLSIWVIYEAILRWREQPEVQGFQMLLIASGGLIINIIAAYLLHSGHKHNLNMRGAFLHVIGDLLGSVAAIAAGGFIILFGWMWADSLSSIVISLIIIFGAGRLILESVNVLLEGTPTHIDTQKVEETILSIDGVYGIHDLHIWTISSGIEALSVHISHGEDIDHSALLTNVRNRLHQNFGIDHLTIQLETADMETETIYVCDTGTNCFETVIRKDNLYTQ